MHKEGFVLNITANVVLDEVTVQFDKPYSYVVPPSLVSKCAKGVRVIVPFGRANKRKQGVVLSISEQEDISNLKPILEVVDTTPVLNDDILLLCDIYACL